MRFIEIGNGTRAINIDNILEMNIKKNTIYFYLKQPSIEGCDPYEKTVCESEAEAKDEFSKILLNLGRR